MKRLSYWTNLVSSVCLLLSLGLSSAQAQLPGVEDVTIELPKFWIGIMGEPADATLKAQLGIDNGVVVADVMENSPAEKAGLKPHDVVLKLNDQPVNDIRDFLQPVAQSEGKPLVLEVLRAGQSQRIEVQPSERPEQAVRPEVRALPKDFRQVPLPPGFPPDLRLPAGDAVRMLFINPGLVVDGKDLPDDVTVTVTKHGNEPAKVVVTRGDDRWETTVDKMSELPEEVRNWIHYIIGPPDILRVNPRFGFQATGGKGALDILMPAPDGANGALQKRVDQLEAQLKELQEMVDKLKQE
jgi:membrane-associated protease RseP (regulator of RpoE activity)